MLVFLLLQFKLVVGEVKTLDWYIPPNTPLNQGLLTAGGFNNRAKREIQLIRLNSDGTVTKRKVRVDLARSIDSKDNPTLRDNDILVVGRLASRGWRHHRNCIISRWRFFYIQPLNNLGD